MNFSVFENSVLKYLKRQLGNDVRFFTGPYTIPVYGGIRPEIHVHASSFLDFNGVTRENAVIARCGISEARLKGYTEERPAEITLAITCVAGNYAVVQNLCGSAIPVVLSFLGTLKTLSPGESPEALSTVRFINCKGFLHSFATSRENDGKGAFFCGRAQFHVNGFLQVTARWKKGAPAPKK
jgi:hypothetical protein